MSLITHTHKTAHSHVTEWHSVASPAVRVALSVCVSTLLCGWLSRLVHLLTSLGINLIHSLYSTVGIYYDSSSHFLIDGHIPPPQILLLPTILGKKKKVLEYFTLTLLFLKIYSPKRSAGDKRVYFTGTDIARNLLFRKLCCGECAGHSRLPFPTPALYRNWTPWLRFHSRHEPCFEQGSDRIPRPFGTLPGEAGLRTPITRGRGGRGKAAGKRRREGDSAGGGG